MLEFTPVMFLLQGHGETIQLTINAAGAVRPVITDLFLTSSTTPAFNS